MQAPDWPDDIFWRPDGDGPDGPDFFRRELGFPHHPGLLEAAMREFTAGGLAMPWLSCFGNHEALNQGVGTQTPGLAAALTGGWKPTALPGGFDSDVALELFTVRPEAFMAGPSRAVPADPGRGPSPAASSWPRISGRARAPSGTASPTRTSATEPRTTSMTRRPPGSSRWTPTAWPAGPTGASTASRPGGWQTASPRSTRPTGGAAGDEIRTGHDDRLVILFSHHGADTLTNTRGWHPGPEGEPLIGAAELVALLHRFPNVVLWLNGHTHTNAVRPRRDPDRPGRGFWEVTTCAVVDWPCQTRLVELADSRRPAVHHLHDGGSRRAAGAADASQPVPGHGSAIQHGRPGRAAP